MKKLARLIITVAAAFSFATGVYAEIPEKVEIKFSVGDSTLLINGIETTVETPYVVGEGVTLVPLRVITEAFGAEVEWISETKSINLSYPDVKIMLQIANPIAEVNGMAETLLSPPELTENGFTMVPLRFISETFGADVSYDEETKAITVVKQATDNKGTIVDEVITQSRIGDSFYGWSMENPMQMDMTYRNFDGTVMSFEASETDWFDIDIYQKEDDYSFERDFIEWKNALTGYSLTKAEKNTNTIVKSMHFQAKNKEEFINLLVFETDKYIIELYGSFENGSEIKDEAIRIMSTFECKFVAADTHDLSEVKNGARPFEAETLKLSLNIPQNFTLISSEYVENEFVFIDPESENLNTAIMINVFSKSDVGTAEELAKEDYENNKKSTNENAVKFTSVETVEYSGFSGFEYTYTISDTKKNDGYTKDVFFEIGDYVYNICVTMEKSTALESKINTVLNSVKAELLDPEEIGILMRNNVDYEGTFTAKSEKWSIELPNNFVETSATDTLAAYVDARTGITFTVGTVADKNITLQELLESAKEIEDEMKHSGPYNTVISARETTIGNTKYATFTLQSREDGAYIQQMAYPRGGGAVVFTVIIPEIYYSEYNKNMIEDIIASYKLTH